MLGEDFGVQVEHVRLALGVVPVSRVVLRAVVRGVLRAVVGDVCVWLRHVVTLGPAHAFGTVASRFRKQVAAWGAERASLRVV
ncbi:hypothetical protein GCM10023335_51580 [Streptomyces siamensis]|uniref:Uncharacterized protein n=1 Tax=Streptomyces siamensis TaxID=1274986 RepID=A0ABP9J868_9ACTN